MARRHAGLAGFRSPVRFSTSRYRLTLDDELDAKRMASEAFTSRRSRSDRVRANNRLCSMLAAQHLAGST